MEPQQIAQAIFSNNPKEPNTIKLGLDESDNEYVFELMLNILLEGIYVKFGTNFNIKSLTIEVITLLNEYMKSMGFTISNHQDKEGHCYCKLDRSRDRYGFSIDKHQLRKNEFIERKKLTDYYINIGESQLNFDFYY